MTMTTTATAPRTLPAPTQRIVPEKFAHVVLKTANFDAVIEWYAAVLQARVAFRNDFIAFLTYDDEHHRVAVLNTPGSAAPDPAAAGVHHIAYTYAGLGELLATYRRSGLAQPNLYRLATSGRLPREDLTPGLEEWAGEPFLLATGEPHLAQALWSFAHGMVILEIDGRYPQHSELDKTWEAGAAAFAGLVGARG